MKQHKQIPQQLSRFPMGKINDQLENSLWFQLSLKITTFMCSMDGDLMVKLKYRMITGYDKT